MDLIISLGAVGRRVVPHHFARQACHLVISFVILYDRCGIWRRPPIFYMVGGIFDDIYFRFIW